MQLELFPWEPLSQVERTRLHNEIRQAYWHIRGARNGRYGWAVLRRYYRKAAKPKKRLLEAGVSRGEVLALLRCCRLQCQASKPPFRPCPYCP